MITWTRDPLGKPGVEHGVLLGDLAADPLGDIVDRRQERVSLGKLKPV